MHLLGSSLSSMVIPNGKKELSLSSLSSALKIKLKLHLAHLLQITFSLDRVSMKFLGGDTLLVRATIPSTRL